jgi:hypothetical protein
MGKYWQEQRQQMTGGGWPALPQLIDSVPGLKRRLDPTSRLIQRPGWINCPKSSESRWS